MSDYEFILNELDLAHQNTGYPTETTFSIAAKAIRSLIRERECLLDDVHFYKSHIEPPC